MGTTLPGTTIEISAFDKGVSRTLFDGIFAAGGVTLAQVAVMTGLEPYSIQNWVKRGFVSSPVHRLYSKNQFARIVIINLLRESFQIDRICTLLGYLNGCLNDERDDVIPDSELYHMYTDMIAVCGDAARDKAAVQRAAEAAAESYVEPIPGAKRRLVKILQVMMYAYYSSMSRREAEVLLSQLD